MRRVLLYTRVSTDEQADRGYSLRDQQARLRSYCDREGLTVVEHFEDDHSAKTFDRPAWNKLLTFIEADPTAVDAVLIVKWDRFSRGATGALSMIRRLEMGVRVQAVEQPIDRIDDVPEQLLLLSFYVAAPEVENRRRSMATKAGMRRALLEGRWMGMAPFGYLNRRGERGRACIDVQEPQASYVREAFRLVADTQMSMNTVRLKLNQAYRESGIRMSKANFVRVLRRPVYAGLLLVPAWRDEPERWVEAIHEALVDEMTWRRVQQRFPATKDCRGPHAGPVAQHYRKLVPELPLRGHLRCPRTGQRLTGSGSTSRHGYRVWYYHGQGKGTYRIAAKRAHEVFEAFLDDVQLASEVVALYRVMAHEVEQDEATLRSRRLRGARERIERLESKLLQVDERFVDGDLERDSYRRLKDKYGRDLAAARMSVIGYERDRVGIAHRLDFAVGVLGRLGQVWHEASMEARDALVGSIWPAGLEIVEGNCRTLEESELTALFRGKTQKIEKADPIFEASVSGGTRGGTTFLISDNST